MKGFSHIKEFQPKTHEEFKAVRALIKKDFDDYAEFIRVQGEIKYVSPEERFLMGSHKDVAIKYFKDVVEKIKNVNHKPALEV